MSDNKLDTKVILEVLTTAINMLEQESTRQLSYHDDETHMGLARAHLRRSDEAGDAAKVLRTLRSRIEKERPFLEAAMAYFEDIDESSFGVAMLAYRTLTEKPPEEEKEGKP